MGHETGTTIKIGLHAHPPSASSGGNVEDWDNVDNEPPFFMSQVTDEGNKSQGWEEEGPYALVGRESHERQR